MGGSFIKNGDNTFIAVYPMSEEEYRELKSQVCKPSPDAKSLEEVRSILDTLVDRVDMLNNDESKGIKIPNVWVFGSFL